jgi:hypothetical protein
MVLFGCGRGFLDFGCGGGGPDFEGVEIAVECVGMGVFGFDKRFHGVGGATVFDDVFVAECEGEEDIGLGCDGRISLDKPFAGVDDGTFGFGRLDLGEGPGAFQVQGAGELFVVVVCGTPGVGVTEVSIVVVLEDWRFGEFTGGFQGELCCGAFVEELDGYVVRPCCASGDEMYFFVGKLGFEEFFCGLAHLCEGVGDGGEFGFIVFATGCAYDGEYFHGVLGCGFG